MNTHSQLRQQIRHDIRKRRQKLTALEQQQAETAITDKALQLIEQKKAHNLALYLSFDGEVSTHKLIKCLWQQGKQVTLPVLHPFCPGHLLFLRYHPASIMDKNQFGILEPKLNLQDVVPLSELEIIFTPLVAVDKQGNRLGMGGGFYDRTLQGWQEKSFLPVGLAHACQLVEHLPTQAWDMPLAQILIAE
ncbi:5-formyltetrahydrofolate cyclo-ligase [Bisgaard Taxon 45]